MKLKIERHSSAGDLHTPVGLYMSLRDSYSGALLLESSDYHSANNSSSFICLQPLACIKIHHGQLILEEKNETILKERAEKENVAIHFESFITKFKSAEITAMDGLFGYIGYDAIQYFEDIQLSGKKNDDFDHPEMIFALFRYVIHLNHFNDIMTIIEYIPEGESSTIGQLKVQIQNTRNNGFPFYTTGATETNITDETFIDMVQKAKYHCRRGDVFQMVLARRFSVSFKGDEFNVYRALRRINPSPYLYFFDYGNFRIFGSSPESQLKISNGKATLNPIAGTYRRTGNDIADKALAEKLSEDPKENAEHAMLVDLARNDLSRSCTNVKVETYKEVQFFSHVIHLVSKVTGKLKTHINPMKVIADTFPAGTLSGAPKHRAMQLIDQYENQSRGFYGGAVGFIGFNGDVNLAILIRSFLSKNNKLFFQAGAGIVNSSDEVSELQEVNNKLAALHKAIEEVDGNRKLTK
ncbi:MAG: anthranilate synthase component I family protein [Bacteroidales bacterium]|nr:anthranilate synthase component I family protein [Bacteroidales bacterium]